MVKLKKKKSIKKEMSIEEAERITGGLELWGQTENFTPPTKDRDLKFPLVVKLEPAE